MSNQNLENKSIDELREMKAKGEAKLKVLHNKSKYYESQINLLTRKERTHRLCTRGAMLEKFLGCPNELTDEQVEEILKIAFQPEAVSGAIEQFRKSNEKPLCKSAQLYTVDGVIAVFAKTLGTQFR